MTSSERDQILGQVTQGTALRTACDCVGVDHEDLLDTLSTDWPFAIALLTALATARQVELYSHPPE